MAVRLGEGRGLHAAGRARECEGADRAGRSAGAEGDFEEAAASGGRADACGYRSGDDSAADWLRPGRSGCGPGAGPGQRRSRTEAAPPGAAPGAGARCGPGAGRSGRVGGGFAFTPNPDAGSWIHDARFYQFFNDGTRGRQVHHHQGSARERTRCMRRRMACWASLRRRTSPSSRARRWTWASWCGSRCASASRCGRSAIPTAPPMSSSRAMARTTGCGAGTCATRCCSRTT